MLVASDPKRVRYSIPLMHLIYSVGAIASGWYVTYLKNGVWYHGYLHTAALFVIFGVYLAFQPTPPSIERYSKRPQRLVDSFSLLKNRKFLAYLLFLILANAIEFTNVVYPFIALTQIHHGGAKEIGLGISILHGGATASRLLVLPLLKKSNRAKTILLILAFISIAALLLFGMAPSLTIAYIAMALLGVGMGGVNPISQVLEISVWPEEIMQLSNIRAMGSTVGRIIIPLAISIIIGSAGLAPIFTFLAVVMGLGTVALLGFRP
jgi:Na+/melibiose symporter-like transporter